MRQVVIENPILNSPFYEPTRHFKFSDDGITDEMVDERRISSYFIPIAPPKKRKSNQMELFETQWTKSRIEENKFINQIRERVALWRQGQYQGITTTTEQLLEYWRNPERLRKLFFCQIEALETAIYITEVARRYGDAWMENDLRHFNEDANPDLYRIAFKMATGSGKTVVMAMLIAWHTLNKLADSRNARFSDTFLIVTPGITIRDRLRVLLPNDPQNYYRKFDLLSPEWIKKVGEAKILITNFHAFIQRESISAGKLTKSILRHDEASPFTETPDQMVRRVCRELGNKKNIIVINDEAHHCYRHKPLDDGDKLMGDERVEAEIREGKARVWISGLEAVKSKIGTKVIYDLSATPFFLRGSGYPEGTLFPWVVSDFSLIDAIECGIVKVPRVPVADDSMTGEQPTYRDLWLRIRDGLPKKGRKSDAVSGEPQLPAALQGALHSLYSNYEKYYQQWEENIEARSNGLTPPVMIVVCNNTNVSKMVYDYIAGWDKKLSDGSTIAVPGQLPIFNNEEHGRWRARPNTILVDSEQLESGDAMSAAFKKVAASEIEQLKVDYRTRFPGRDIDKITDEDLLREVMNTVGKPGKLGEQVKCVVSVSMLTEGWDCLDSKTEILTPQGWIGRGQAHLGDLVYALNRDTGKLEVVPILEYGERPVLPGERMTRIKSQHLDIRVTEGHEFHIKYRDPRASGTLSQQMITKTGAQLFERRSAYALPLAAETADSFPGIPLSDDEIRLIAWFMTDGGFSNYNLAISQSQSKRFHHEIRDLLNRLGLDYVERLVEPSNSEGAFENAKPYYVFRIPQGVRTGSLARNGWYKYREYLDKSVAPALHAMTRRQFLVFWEELLKGDGERTGNKSGWLWCCDKTQADAYTHMAVVRGLAASYHAEITNSGKTVYRVSVRDTQWITSDPGDERASKIVLEEPEPGEVVWCIRNRSSTLVTRRNGKTAILGNCHTTTHILGVRAFGTQLLCEQVVGRGLRRTSYAINEQDRLEPEYAEVYGVPFSFIPCSGSQPDPKPGPIPTRVRALEERIACEITFPRLVGYRYDFSEKELTYNFTADSKLTLSTQDIPTWTENAPIVGESSILTLDDIKRRREQEVAFLLAKLVLEKYFRRDGTERTERTKEHHFDSEVQAWLFPQVLHITKRWLANCVIYKDNTFPQMLLLIEFAHDAADRIYRAIVASESGEKRLKPILHPYDTLGSTRYVDFDTTRDVYQTDPTKCHISHVALDSDWEAKMVQGLEEMDEVVCYTKNQGLGFTIPYTLENRERKYFPDFIIRMNGNGAGPLNLICEVSGERRKDKVAKVATARNLWTPAVNNHGGFGQWDFLEISDPWDAKNTIFAALNDRNNREVY